MKISLDFELELEVKYKWVLTNKGVDLSIARVSIQGKNITLDEYALDMIKDEIERVEMEYENSIVKR